MNDRIRNSQLAVRAFLVDEGSGKPAAGTTVSLSADFPDGGTSLLATLRSDGAGYVSFKLDPSAIAGASRLRVTRAGAPGDALVLSADDALAGHAHTVRLDVADRVRTRHLGLPAIQSPDAVDLALSPGSIGMTPQLLPVGGLCGQLMPTTLAVQRFTAFQIVPDNICEPETWSCPEELQIVRGRMLEYEITWNPAGAALGDLLNTITRAPSSA